MRRHYLIHVVLTKQAKAWALIQDNLPSLLKRKPTTESVHGLYWDLGELWWSNESPEFAELTDFFEELDESGLPEPRFAVAHYGAIAESGEESNSDDEYGDPSGLGLIKELNWYPHEIDTQFEEQTEVTYETPGVHGQRHVPVCLPD